MKYLINKVATERILSRRAGASVGGEGGVGEKEKSRILNKFRNSFVNLARPLLAFAQPVEAESFLVNHNVFNMWSVIQV
jgi:hypothetical protein